MSDIKTEEVKESIKRMPGYYTYGPGRIIYDGVMEILKILDLILYEIRKNERE